jgi:hypothetical protein
MNSFEKALAYLKNGGCVSRDNWNGKGLFISLQKCDENSKMTRDYLYITTPIGSTNQFGAFSYDKCNMIPWVPNQTDLLSNDWNLLPKGEA